MVMLIILILFAMSVIKPEVLFGVVGLIAALCVIGGVLAAAGLHVDWQSITIPILTF